MGGYLVMGVHRGRLAVSKAHRRFVRGAKMALQQWAVEKFRQEIPVTAISPSASDGVQLLLIPVPPMLEEALAAEGPYVL